MWRERREQSLWLCPVSSCSLTTLISATEGNRKPLCTHTSFLLTGFSRTFRPPVHGTGSQPSSSDIFPFSILISHSLHFLSQRLSATVFCGTICPGWTCMVSPQPKLFLRSKCMSITSLKSKLKLMIKGNRSSFLPAPGSEFPPSRPLWMPEDCFICWMCISLHKPALPQVSLICGPQWKPVTFVW